MATADLETHASDVGSVLLVTAHLEFARRLRTGLESHRRIVTAHSIDAARKLLRAISFDVVYVDSTSIDPSEFRGSRSPVLATARDGKESIKELARRLVVLSAPGLRANPQVLACVNELVRVSGLTLTQTAMLCCFVERGSDHRFAQTHHLAHATLKSHRHAILANTGFSSMLALRSTVLATALGLASDEGGSGDRD